MRLGVFRPDGSLRLTMWADDGTGRLSTPLAVEAGETVLIDRPGELAAVPTPITEPTTIYTAALLDLMTPGRQLTGGNDQ